MQPSTVPRPRTLTWPSSNCYAAGFVDPVSHAPRMPAVLFRKFYILGPGSFMCLGFVPGLAVIPRPLCVRLKQVVSFGVMGLWVPFLWRRWVDSAAYEKESALRAKCQIWLNLAWPDSTKRMALSFDIHDF